MHINETRKRIFAYVLNIILFIITAPARLFRKKKKVNLTAPKILVSRPDHIGDVLMSTPVYHSLKDKFPNSKVVLICGTWGRSVVSNNPYIDEIWIIDCPWWTGIRKDVKKEEESFYARYKKLLKKIKQEQFDIFIELRSDIRHTFLFGWMPNIPMRISNDRSGGGFLVTHSIPYKFELHEIHKNHQLLKVFDPIPLYDKTEMYIRKEDTGFFERLPIQEKYIVLFNGGRAPLRRLQEVQVLDLIQALHNKYHLQCIMVGGKEDAERGTQISNIINDENIFLSCCGVISLAEVKALIEKAVLFIGNDSSVSQIAASTYTPAISLYGPMIPGQVKPLGDEKKEIYHQYPCSPCLQVQCVVNKSFTEAQCMLDIKTGEILELAGTLLPHQ